MHGGWGWRDREEAARKMYRWGERDGGELEVKSERAAEEVVIFP